MKVEELKSFLRSLLSRWEDEVVEFKRGGAGFSTGEIGEYFSALANEANLRCLPHAWLVFGVDNKTRKVVGTDHDASPDALNRSGGIKYQDVCLLDRIQKHLVVPAAAVAHLRREGLIEGRMPHPHISAIVAEATGRQAEYMRKKELSGSRYRAMLIDYIGRFNGLTRRQINDYMIPEIRGELSNEEKIVKISNLMTYMRRSGKIVNTGSATKPLWKLSDKQ